MGPTSGGPLIGHINHSVKLRLGRGPAKSAIFPFCRQKHLHVAWLPIRVDEKGSYTHMHPQTHTRRKSGNLKLFMLWILSVVKHQGSAAEQWGWFCVSVCWMLVECGLLYSSRTIYFSHTSKHLNKLRIKGNHSKWKIKPSIIISVILPTCLS